MLGEHFFKPSKLCKSFYINDLQKLVRGTPLKPRLCKKEMKKTRPKEDYDPRNIILNLRVNKEEAEWIEQ